MHAAWPFLCSGGLGGTARAAQYVFEEIALGSVLLQVFQVRSHDLQVGLVLAEQPFLHRVSGGPVAALPCVQYGFERVPEFCPADDIGTVEAEEQTLLYPEAVAMVRVVALRPFGAGSPDEERIIFVVEQDPRPVLGDPPATGQAQPVTAEPVVRHPFRFGDRPESPAALGRWPPQFGGIQAQHRLRPQPEFPPWRDDRGGGAPERNDVACPVPRRGAILATVHGA